MMGSMSLKIYINSIGIICASIGAFLVWRYLTELNFTDKDAYLKGEGLLVIPSPTPEDIKRFRRTVLLSKIGLGLILIGGVLQVISNHCFEF